MRGSLVPTVLGVVAAIGITTAMDATGYSMFSALPLLPLALIFWGWQRFSRAEMGLRWGGLRNYGLALLYPVVVLGAMTLIALLMGVMDTSEAHWKAVGINLLLGSSIGSLMVLLTEEGFFRGWLWASLRRAGRSRTHTLIYSSLLFTLWHVSAISLETGFNVPLPQIPVYLINATLLGLIWGMMRLLSGSALVASVSHAVWNPLAYGLFGFGEKIGALGIERSDLYGPEVGLLGVVLNSLFAAGLWVWLQRQPAAESASPG
jgi:membrane protease YdiL (CAAX protease family)